MTKGFVLIFMSVPTVKPSVPNQSDLIISFQSIFLEFLLSASGFSSTVIQFVIKSVEGVMFFFLLHAIVIISGLRKTTTGGQKFTPTETPC